MSAPLIASSLPTGVRRHRVRNTAVVAGVAMVIAAGGYAATNTFGPDAHEAPLPASQSVPAADSVRQEMHQSVAGQYGSRSAGGDAVQPSAPVLDELHQSTAGQYGGR
jgi:hypothetical protein